MAIYRIWNGAAPTTAALAKVATGTAIKTMLQVKMGTTKPGKCKRWSMSFDGSAAGVPILCELIETDVAATVTAHVAAGLVKVDGEALAGGDPTTNLILVGTTATGYTASGEGTITASRLFDAQLVAPTNQYIYNWPLSEEPIMQVSLFTRIRVTAPVSVNALCFVDVEV